MDNISVTLTGRISDAPAAGVTGNGKPWASFSLAVDVPRGRGDQREYQTRWVKVWCRGPLAEHAADSLVKGDRVTVRADDITAQAWTADGPDHQARAQLQVQAYEVAASMRFETLTTAKAARAHFGRPPPDPRPLRRTRPRRAQGLLARRRIGPRRPPARRPRTRQRHNTGEAGKRAPRRGHLPQPPR